MNTLDKAIVLKLNQAWQPIAQRTVKQAIADLAGSDGYQPKVMAMDIVYARDEYGEYDLGQPEYYLPVSWDQWMELPVRDCDMSIKTPGKEIRVPTVIVEQFYSGMPVWSPAPTRQAIFDRDGGICQYSGRKISWREGNLDHVLPRSRGGRNTFENLVWSDKRINSIKSDRTPKEAGLNLIRKPLSPKTVPVSYRFREARHRDWHWFLIHKL